MQLIVLTDPEFFVGEAALINELFERGLPLLHVRKPDADEHNVRRLLDHIRSEYYDRVAIHYFHHLAEEYELGGVHLSASHPKAPEGWEGRVSASCHSLEEALQRLESCDYVFVSPIYDSISKEGYLSAFTRRELEAARDAGKITRRMIALGGVTPERIPDIEHFGFGGAAVVGSLWGRRGWDEVVANYWSFIEVNKLPLQP